MKPTPFSDINNVLTDLSSRIKTIFGENLIGLYLTGSLSYGDFNPGSSDIDLVAVLHNPTTEQEIIALKQMHERVAKSHKKWVKCIECSYTPLKMFQNILPPKVPRPYYGEGIFYHEAQYGNEWIINNYLLYKYGIALTGPDFKTLIKPIDIVDVQKACIQDLFKEWQPKITDEVWLQNSHYQSYVVLNICRILYTVMCNETASKQVSALWVKKEFPNWKNLIERAEQWEYGEEMKLQKETAEFIKFAIHIVKDGEYLL